MARAASQAQEHPPDVHALDAVPLLCAHLQDRRHPADPGREYGDGGRTQLVDHLLHGGDDVVLVTHVAFHGEIALSFPRLQIEHGDSGAPVAQSCAGRGADAARATGDEGDGSVEVHGRLLLAPSQSSGSAPAVGKAAAFTTLTSRRDG